MDAEGQVHVHDLRALIEGPLQETQGRIADTADRKTNWVPGLRAQDELQRSGAKARPRHDARSFTPKHRALPI